MKAHWKPIPLGRCSRTAARCGVVGVLALCMVVSGCVQFPVDRENVATAPPASPGEALPGDYLTDLEKDYFLGKISTWAYYASPLFIGGNPATEDMRFWDRVDYEWIFFGNFPKASFAMFKDLFLDWWIALPRTWSRQFVRGGLMQINTPLGIRNTLFGLADGAMDSAHELFDAAKIFDGHWKLPFHPGCTYEGGVRLVSFIINRVLIGPTKPAAPVYYFFYPIGGIFEMAARGFNAGFLIGIKICKWPPMLAEGLCFGGWDLITFRERRGPFKGKILPFSFKSGCVLYMYDGDMDYRRGSEIAPSKPPRKRKQVKPDAAKESPQ